jgi:hypothetical protein
MKKEILALVIGFLFLGINLYAEGGDLIVYGKVGIGRDNPQKKVHIEQITTNDETAPGHLLGGHIIANDVRFEKNIAAGYYYARLDNTIDLSVSRQIGINAFSQWTGRANFTQERAVIGGIYQAAAEPNSYNINLSDLVGISGTTGAYDFSGSADISNAISVHADGHHQSMLGKTTTNAYDIYGRAHRVTKGTITNAYGIYLEQQTAGVNNYGIVLDGDGIGSDLVLGGNQEVRLYGDTGNFIVDTSGNVGIGTMTPTEKLDVEGNVEAWGFITGDITFQKDGKKLWRMFEDEGGLYIENVRTGKVYKFVLQEVEKK